MIWWPPYRRRVHAAAGEYIASYADDAGERCKVDQQAATDKRDFEREKFLRNVARAIEQKLSQRGDSERGLFAHEIEPLGTLLALNRDPKSLEK